MFLHKSSNSTNKNRQLQSKLLDKAYLGSCYPPGIPRNSAHSVATFLHPLSLYGCDLAVTGECCDPIGPGLYDIATAYCTNSSQISIFQGGMDPVRINLAAYALLKWVWTLSPILTNGSNTRTWIWNYTPMHALLNSSTILDLDTPIRVGLVKSNMATHLLFSGNMGKCSSFLHLVFGPISWTLGISLPTVTSKAKLWPCQRTPRHKRRPHQNCLLGAMQKMEDVTRSVTQKQTTFRSRMHETCGMDWHGRSTKKYLYQKIIHRVTRIKMHNCMLVRTYIFV